MTDRAHAQRSALSSFKQADGRYRWVLFSSSSFRDRDGEIISQAAQEADCAAMNASKNFGTLDWWHDPHLILGDCDFAAMHGRIRVESGTYRDSVIGAAMAAQQETLAASIAFFHPVTEPVAGVYKTIRTFSRAILPRGTESNILTRLFVAQEEEPTMVKSKIDALVHLLGGGQDAQAKVQAILATAGETEQKAAAAGIEYKAANAEPEPAQTDAPAEAAQEPAAAAPDAKADMPGDPNADPAALDQGAPEPAGEDAGEMAQMVAALQSVIAPLVARIEELAATMGQQAGMMSALQSSDDAVAKAANETKTALTAARADIETLKARVQELEGETPRGQAKPGFVASRATSNTTQAAKSAPAPMDAAIATINQFILGGQPNN